MDLFDYLHEKRKENRKFKPKNLSDALGISSTYLNLILNGMRKPSIELGIKIEELTEGKVTYLDMTKHYLDNFKKEKKKIELEKQIEEEKKKEQDSA